MNYEQKLNAILAETVENLKAAGANGEKLENGAIIIMSAIPVDEDHTGRHTVILGSGPSISTTLTLAMADSEALETACKVAQKTLPLAKLMSKMDDSMLKEILG